MYTALNDYHQNVTGGKKLERYVLLQKLLRSSTRKYVTKKAAVYSGEQLDMIFKKLDNANPGHLESKVGGILGIFGLLRVNEILKLTIDDVTRKMKESSGSAAWEVEYPYATKTKPTGFGFMVPGKYREEFELYLSQIKCPAGNSRFLKNMNAKAKKRSQNLGRRKVESWPKLWCDQLGMCKSERNRYSTHSFR